ncbi:aldehyde dehydrogenase family protein [Nocardia sp. SYP-A9097]|uniref:aldehyde dehydrogenase family protein n=1 Tax=Nocardia sp. SYP-A9097 TaxID=2663237 RepID=UPI00129B1B7F|nr:aldehyde dehydrogenase family protein [Nocardia sp. SYP-A9097]MRH93603.1 aldehyde dehydrogenase family protein [Nocardia sp. SYP-A9097]
MASPSKSRPILDTEAGLIHVRRPADGGLRDAQREWERIGVKARTKWLLRMRQWLLDNEHRLVEISRQEGGKVRNEPLLETILMVEVIDYYARVAPKLLSPKHVRGASPLVLGKRFTVDRSAFPLAGVIGAWNFPLLLTFGDAIPALFAGSAVLLKPSEVTPLAVRELVRGWHEIGAPPVVEVLLGGGETGAALVDAVDFVQFTGSVATGKKVAQRAAESVTPVSLELGGKDPCLVLAGANLERAANCAVYGGFANNGQVCMGFERVYVETSVYDEFVERVVAKVKSLRSGIDEHSDVGALTSAPQIDIVDAQVQDAIDKGAKALTGGYRMDRPGTWYAPTVLVDVDHSMTLMREETFGPVLPIVRVADAEEAIRLANDSEFGLSATVFAASTKEGERIAARLEVGAVNINDFLANMTCAEVPQGGWKNSGIGSRASEYGLLKFTRTKVVSSSWLPAMDSEPNWFPYTPTRWRIFRSAARFVHGRGLGRLGIS